MKVSNYSTSLPGLGGKRGPFVRATSATAEGKGEGKVRREKEETAHGERARFEKAWRGVVRQNRWQETERERENKGQERVKRKKRRKQGGATKKKLDEGIGLLIREGSYSSLSLSLFPLLLFPLLALHPCATSSLQSANVCACVYARSRNTCQRLRKQND